MNVLRPSVRICAPFVLVLIACAIGIQAQTPAGSAFTYQGTLKKSGNRADGDYDLEFRLYDAAAGGALIGTNTKENIPVSNGQFTVRLDFGEGAFNGDARWLEISVRRGNSTGPYTPLLPRQELTPTPYALFALDARPGQEVEPKSQLAKEFVVADGQSIGAGDVVGYIGGKAVKGFPGMGFEEFVFNEGATKWTSTAELNPNKFVVSYSDLDNSEYGTAIVGEVFGNTVAFGPEAVYASTSTEETSVATLSENKVVIIRRGSALIGTVSGNTLTFGPTAVFNSSDAGNHAVAALSSSQFVVVYTADNGARTVVGSVSGDSISYGPQLTFGPATSSQSLDVAKLSASRVVIGFIVPSGLSNGWTVVGDISGNQLTLGPETILIGGPSQASLSIAVLSSDRFVAASTVSLFGPGVVWPGSVTGNAITIFGQFPYYAGNSYFVNIVPTANNGFVLAYRDNYHAGIGIRISGEVLAGEVVFNEQSVFNSGSTWYISAAPLSEDAQVIAFGDNGSARRGTVVISRDSEPSIPIGIAKTPAQAGQNVLVITDGISDAHTGLTPEKFYYARHDGSLTRTRTEVPVGWSLSETEILLRGEFGPPEL